jgi:hypothetical protein
MIHRYHRALLLSGLLINVFLWALTATAQVDDSAEIVSTLIGKDPSLGFAGFVIALVLIFLYLDGKNHREERDKWVEQMSQQTATLSHLDQSIQSLEKALERSLR